MGILKANLEWLLGFCRLACSVLCVYVSKAKEEEETKSEFLREREKKKKKRRRWRAHQKWWHFHC